MKILKNFNIFLNERFDHTEQDKIENMRMLAEFSEKFESEIGSLIKLQEYEKNKYNEHLGYGFSIYTVDKIFLKIENEEQYDSIFRKAMIWLNTKNKSKVDNKIDEIYTIKIGLKGIIFDDNNDGKKYRKVVTIKKFNTKSLDMNEVIENFKEYIKSELK